ncbi:hypothetical protein HanHA300_Chr05g0190851 [Helianthus annuus]|nr:hypothetical protein HanHA300_Chr05g0190851 [Helianthus annuus]KAJ0585904.1 hypothetical protein HanHA89_Chr05g0205991 [Helianthus annuus]KAJ0924170.1 hypothetical protein HanPSC8_Chr05g0225161 [Helianthus annuus]
MLQNNPQFSPSLLLQLQFSQPHQIYQLHTPYKQPSDHQVQIFLMTHKIESKKQHAKVLNL